METQDFIKYLQEKNLAPFTIHRYAKSVEQFFEWAKVEDIQVTKPDVLRFLEWLKGKGLKNKSRKHHLISINHYFTFLYKQGEITSNPCLSLKIRGTKKKHLHKIYTLEELETLFDNFYHCFIRNIGYNRMRSESKQEYILMCKERNAVMLNLIIYQRATSGNIEKLEVDDIDLFKATIKIRGGRRSNDRILPINATQIGLLMHYIQHTRPKMLEYWRAESDKLLLFHSAVSINTTLTLLMKQIKSIDKQFLSFKQLRASTLCFWLKMYGLRKTQYLAGHRYVSSTEDYLCNNLEELADNIDKMHPF